MLTEQLNLFGDFTNFDSFIEKEEKHVTENSGSRKLGTDGGKTLETVSTEILSGVGGERGIDSEAAGSRGKSRRYDGGSDQSGIEAQRSNGDSSSTIHSPSTRGIDSNSDERGNYSISSQDEIGKGGKVSKFEDNFNAISILKDLEKANRNATEQEQSLLVKYTGWGGLSEVFKKELSGPWKERQNRLKEIISEDEYKQASRSTINAHYTSPTVVKAVWNAVEKMGYSGGPTLEPAAGTGMFFGLRPENIPIEMHGIELDSISGKIAQQLYQSADIKIKGFEQIKLDESAYNLIISNVPFADIKPYEEKSVRTPGLDNRYALHDFYFLKSLHGLKENGIYAFISSRYTMDKLDSSVREKIAEKADFLGAIRLPNTAFKEIANTEVVSDIIFLQKRSIDKEMSEQTKEFINCDSIDLKASDGELQKVSINSYYINHPEMILGEQSLTGTMFSGNDYTVSINAEELSEKLHSAVQSLPENVCSIAVDSASDKLDKSIENPLAHLDSDTVPYGAFIIGQDEQLYQKQMDGGIELSSLYNNTKKNEKEINRIKSLVEIKTTLKTAFEAYSSNNSQVVENAIKTLNIQYDGFTQKNGFINSKENIKAFYIDPDSSLICSLEKWDPKSKTAEKADIFKGISFVKNEMPSQVDSPLDAMILSLSRYGHLNIPYMESVTGTDRELLTTTLLSEGHAFLDPKSYMDGKSERYLTADEYLSGNIRKKLHFAQKAMEREPLLFSRNVSELEKIMPKDIGPEDISLKINSPIVGDKHVKEFVGDLLDCYSVNVVHMPITGKWEIKAAAKSSLNFDTYGTHDMPAVKILNNIMNGKPIKVYDKGDKDSPPTLNPDKTAAAEMKAEQIQNAFQRWVWQDKDRTDDIVKRYNEVDQ